MLRRLTIGLVGLLTIWPFCYIPWFFWVVHTGASGGQVASFNTIFPLHMGTMVGGFVALVAVLVHLWHNERLTSDRRILWAVLLVNLGMLVQPIYWYVHMWSEPVATLE